MSEPMFDVQAVRRDLFGAISSYRIWHLLAMQDIRQRYRRSVLGPFWITLSTLISIAALGVVYSKIFKIPTAEYLPFLTVGIVGWTFISTMVMESCAAFTSAEAIIKQVNLPFGLYVLRIVWRNFIILAHLAVVVVLVLISMRIPLTWYLLLLPASLAIVAAASIAAGYLLGGLCTRFRDVAQIISSLIQVVFYVTPVIWQPALLKGHEEIMLVNPFYHFLEILRGPVLGKAVDPISWAVSIGLSILLWIGAVLFIARYRKRIAFWL